MGFCSRVVFSACDMEYVSPYLLEEVLSAEFRYICALDGYGSKLKERPHTQKPVPESGFAGWLFSVTISRRKSGDAHT